MNTLNHAPQGYECPFCNFIKSISDGAEDAHALSKFSDVVAESDLSLAFFSIKWWPNNPGHVLVVPKLHFENIYEIPDHYLADVSILSKLVALGMKNAFSCAGTSTRQHNEPAGYQDVWHFHQHVFPRWDGDNLYFERGRLVSPQERAPFGENLRQAIHSIKTNNGP